MAFLRKNIRLPVEHYTGKRIYFVTICTENHRPAFNNDSVVARILETLTTAAQNHKFAVHAYCFMPDHLHVLVEGLTDQSQLLQFIRSFKQTSAFAYTQTFRHRLWQRTYYDHVLRRDDAIADVAWYIWMNPIRKGLCQHYWEYPFSGSFTMPWRDRPQPLKSWQPPWKEKPVERCLQGGILLGWGMIAYTGRMPG